MSTKAPETYGYIGLGVMGWHMADNLAKKLPSSAGLYVYDINQEMVEKLCKHESGRVYACKSAADVAAKSVSLRTLITSSLLWLGLCS